MLKAPRHVDAQPYPLGEAEARQAARLLTSSALASGMIICVAPNALVSASDPRPRIDLSDQAVFVMDDTAPAQIGTVGSPNVAGAPARSLFQNDEIGLRLRLEINWTLRTTGAVAWTQAVLW